MKVRLWLLSAIAGMMLQTAVVHASSPETIVKAETKADFAVVAGEVRKQMLPGGRFEFATSKERADIEANLNDMQSLFDKFGTVAAMDQPSKLKIFNDQEALNAMLTRRDDKRLVCEHVEPLGSHIPKTTCRTYGQMERDQRDMQHMLDKSRQVQSVNQVNGKHGN